MAWPYLNPYTRVDYRATVSSPSASVCGNFINTILKLSLMLFQTFREWIDQNGNLTATFLSMIYTPGDLRASAAPQQNSSLQNGTWLLCDGSQYQQSVYPDLYAAIGDVYATQTNPNIGSYNEDGVWVVTAAPSVSSGSFRVPDLRGLALVGVGSLGQSGGSISSGVASGEELHALNVEEGAQDYTHNHITGKFEGLSSSVAGSIGLLTGGVNVDAPSQVQAGDSDPLRICDGTGQIIESDTDSSTGIFTVTGPVNDPVDYNYTTKVQTPFTGHNTMQPNMGVFIYIFAGVPVTANTDSSDDTLTPI